MISKAGILSPGDSVWIVPSNSKNRRSIIIRPAVVTQVKISRVFLDVYLAPGKVQKRVVSIKSVQRRNISIPDVIEDCGKPEVLRDANGGTYDQRLRSLPDTLTHDQWEYCKEYFGQKCAYCRKRDGFIREHYVPVSAPDCPGTVATNIVPACNECNLRKKSIMPDVWLKSRPDVQQHIDRYFDIVRRAEKKKPFGDQQPRLFKRALTAPALARLKAIYSQSRTKG